MMRITLFGVIWLLFVGYSFIHGKPYRMVRAVMLSMVLQQPAVVIVGGGGIGPPVITSAAFILWFLYFRLLKKDMRVILYKSGWVKKVSTLSCIFLIAAIIGSYMKNGVEPMNDLFGLYFLLLCTYITCFLLMWGLRYELTSGQVREIFTGIVKAVSMIGFVQFINTCGIINISFILRLLLYNNTDYGLRIGEAAYSWSLPRLFSTFQEPSYCAAFLVGTFYYLIAYGMNSKTDIRLAVVVLVEIILTFSSTAYGAFAVCGVIYLIISGNKKALKILIPLAVFILVVIILSGQLDDIWNTVIMNKLDITKSGSAWTRNLWNKLALESFYSSPILGVGYRNCRASYVVFSVLGQLGGVGCIVWMGMWLPCFIKGFFSKKEAEIISMTLFFAGVICAMLIAIPDIDFCVFWLAMYLMALVGQHKRDRMQRDING